MNGELVFLPWLRRGLAQGIKSVDSLAGSMSKNAAVTARITINAQEITKQINLRGPEQVAGIDVNHIVRIEPKPDSQEFEPNYFPLLEFDIADLPWLFTPASPDDQGRLRPWLVLIVVKVQEGVGLSSLVKSSLSVLDISSPSNIAVELPDLSESWAWAHVQSIVPANDVAAAVEADSGEVISRLICPRKLEDNCSYLACLVPAFDLGVKAGLGDSFPETDVIEPAWSHNGDEIQIAGQAVTSIRLPVYYSWRFQTGQRGDFESLCRKLRPDTEAERLGLYPIDVSDPGLIASWPESVYTDYKGVMQLFEAESTNWNPAHKAKFINNLEPLLNAGATRTEVDLEAIDKNYNPDRDDPIIAPPLYGAWQADRFDIPDKGWLAEVNLSPANRAAAGLGARVIRKNQEMLMAAAWDQVGDLKQTCDELNRGRLAVEVGRSMNRKLSGISDGDLVQVTKPLHTYIKTESGTVESNLHQSKIPNGLVSFGMQRVGRPGQSLNRQWNKSTAGSFSSKGLVSTSTGQFLKATNPDSSAVLKSIIDYAQYGIVKDTQTNDPTLTLEENESSTPTIKFELNQVEQDRLLNKGIQSDSINKLDIDTDSLFGSIIEKGVIVTQSKTKHIKANDVLLQDAQSKIEKIAEPMKSDTLAGENQADVTSNAEVHAIDMSETAGVLRIEMDPLESVRLNLVTRIPMLDSVLTENILPTKIYLGPVFEDAMYPDLLALGAHLVCPGIDELKRNRVRALQSNSVFVASFMTGCNHEMSRELLWREYPADLAAVFFHRFWNYIDPDQNDLVSSPWNAEATIDSILTRGNVNDTVIVIRGELVRRYPNTHYYLQKAVFEGAGTDTEPLEGKIIESSFVGKLAHDTVFFGFELEPEVVRGDRGQGDPGYYFGIEQLASEPRFGLDNPKRNDLTSVPIGWLDLSWGHLAETKEALQAMSHASTRPLPRLTDQTIDSTTWAYNASHMAQICYQKPFRMLIHADMLI